MGNYKYDKDNPLAYTRLVGALYGKEIQRIDADQNKANAPDNVQGREREGVKMPGEVEKPR